MKPESAKQKTVERRPYETPAIIYEGELTTRAGSNFPNSGIEYDVDPAKLFGSVD